MDDLHAPKAEPGVERTSVLLTHLTEDHGEPRISIGEIVFTLRARAFGLLLLLFALPCMLPSPPPIPLICASVMMLVAANMIGGRRTVWLPETLTRRTIDRAALAGVIARVMPTLLRIERVCQPRWLWVIERGGRVPVGAMIILLGIILLIPLPVVGNFTPGLAVAVMGLGIAERDGIVMGVGLVLSLVAVLFSAFLGWVTFEAVLAGFEWLF